jgi:hypothetical protein
MISALILLLQASAQKADAAFAASIGAAQLASAMLSDGHTAMSAMFVLWSVGSNALPSVVAPAGVHAQGRHLLAENTRNPHERERPH